MNYCKTDSARQAIHTDQLKKLLKQVKDVKLTTKMKELYRNRRVWFVT
jgi:hypothetical protein